MNQGKGKSKINPTVGLNRFPLRNSPRSRATSTPPTTPKRFSPLEETETNNPIISESSSSETLDSLSDLEPQHNSFTLDSETETAMPPSKSPSGSQREHQSRDHSPTPSNSMSEHHRNLAHQDSQGGHQTIEDYTEDAEHPEEVLWTKYYLSPLQKVSGEIPIDEGKEFPKVLTRSEIKNIFEISLTDDDPALSTSFTGKFDIPGISEAHSGFLAERRRTAIRLGSAYLK